MNLFARGSLPTADAASLRAEVGRPVRPLAWARTADGVVVGLVDALAQRMASGWTLTAWHEIVTGGFADGVLRWTGEDGVRHEAEITEPGRLPELFKERVDATFLLQRQITVGRGRLVVVSARRDLGRPEAPATWTVTAGPGVDLADPSTRAVADAELARLRAEYAI